MAWVITLIYGLGDDNELNDADIKNTQRFVRQNKPVYICEPMQKNAVYKKNNDQWNRYLRQQIVLNSTS